MKPRGLSELLSPKNFPINSMDPRRRAELLASLSPEGLATYEVLKAQLARDLDRSFAASQARLEKSVETAFDDLHTKLDETIGRLRHKVRTDASTRCAPAAAALASSATSSTRLSACPAPHRLPHQFGCRLRASGDGRGHLHAGHGLRSVRAHGDIYVRPHSGSTGLYIASSPGRDHDRPDDTCCERRRPSQARHRPPHQRLHSADVESIGYHQACHGQSSAAAHHLFDRVPRRRHWCSEGSTFSYGSAWRCSTKGVEEDTSVKSPESALGMCLPTIVPLASFQSSLMPLADANLRCTHIEKANMFQLLNNNDNILFSKEQGQVTISTMFSSCHCYTGSISISTSVLL
uniref:Uncharacterized protein n=1 Tax=Aegilops tauschii subsp. strangulata TaxID=200361 RepID=A0A453CDX4_AEGTS